MLNEKAVADETFHALVYGDRREWDQTCERVLRFLNSLEGRRYAARSRAPIVLLVSDRRRGRPYYLHVSDGALQVLRDRKIEFSIYTSAFLEELPDNQIVLYSSVK